MLHALHGFLGKPSDWDFLHSSNIPVKAYDIFQFGKPSAKCGYHQWADAFNKGVSVSKKSLNVLLGYSLGGRLALHSVIKDPQLWDAVIIVSAHPGLKTAHEKMQRLEEDRVWGERFAKDPWELLMKEWNKRPIFKENDQSIPRFESDHPRELSRDFFDYWSLSQQDYLLNDIQQLNLPILWITGEHDQKYTQLAESIKLKHQKSCKVVVPGCGHRVPWENSDAFKEKIHKFLNY